MRTPDLAVTGIRGSARRCGEEYGDAFATEIAGFLMMETPPTPARLRMATSALGMIARHTPRQLPFLEGMARGAGLSLEEAALLTLHEEVVHQEHCTALGASGESTGRGAILGQNWDWSPRLFPWPGLLDLNRSDGPRTLTYHYPGLWAAAGLNEHGLGLLWTGGGYYPSVKPAKGVPTYVLIAEVLRKKDVSSALRFLGKTPRAGCFLFFLGDAKGRLVVVEGIPGLLRVDRKAPVLCRANHFLLPEVLKKSRQSLPPDEVYDTRKRHEAIAKAAGKSGRLTLTGLRRALSVPPVYRFGLNTITVDSLCIVSSERRLLVRRGGPTPKRWRSHTIPWRNRKP